MNVAYTRLGKRLAALVGAVLLGLTAIGTSAGAAVTYEGRAAIVVITDSNSLPGGSLTLCDTGPLPASGGALEQTVANVNEAGGGILMDIARAATVGEGPRTFSEVSMTNLALIINAPFGGISTFSASFVGATATATCAEDGTVSVAGSADIQGVVLNGAAVEITGELNQEVAFPGGRIIFNEQTSDVAGNTGEIVVIPIHILVEGCMNGTFGLAHAGITCEGLPPPPPPAAECGKLTGGGWITGTPSGDKGNFGVSGGIRRGEFWGHLNYIDHDTGMHVRSTAVTGFTVDPSDADCRIITYNVLIDDAAGTATVRACDKGEPGRDDIFEITLSSGYHAAGDLGGARPGGGNIQLHKCPPGWE